MNPEDPNVQAWLEPELEARLVASLLGEASAFEDAELERLIAERPEITVFQRRLEAVHGLVGEASSQGPDDEWKLSKDRRDKVLETIRGKSEKDTKVTAVVAKKPSRSLWYGAAAVAAVTVFAGSLVTMSTNLSSRSVVASSSKTRDIDMKGTPGVVEFEGFVDYSKSSRDLAMLDDVSSLDRNEALLATTSPESRGYFEENELRFGVNQVEQEVELAAAIKKAAPTEEFMLAQTDALSDSDFIKPEIITRSGRESQVEVLRELVEPEFYDAPELPQESADGLIADTFPVTPAQPSTLEQRDLAGADTEKYFSTRSSAPEINVHGRPRMNLWGLEPAQQSELADSQSPKDTGDAWLWDFDNDGTTEPNNIDLFGSKNDGNRGGNRELYASVQSSEELDVLQTNKSDPLVYDRERTRLLDQVIAKWELPTPAIANSEAKVALTDQEDPTVELQFFDVSQDDSKDLEFDGLVGGFVQTEQQAKLAEQEVKVEVARLAMLDQAERYRNIDFSAMQGQIAETEKWATTDEKANVQRFSKAKKTFEAEKETLYRFREANLGEALAQAGVEGRREILKEQLEKLTEQEGQVAALGGRYKIPELLQRQDEAVITDDLSAIVVEAKKDTAMDDRRKLEEFQEAQQELAVRRKFVEKAKQTLEFTKQQSLIEKHAKQEPFSTFSLHVSDVAFKLAKAALLEQNRWPEVAKVRIEEFVNAFDYGDPAPSQAEKVACRLEQAAHPFRQQRNVLRVAMRTAEMGRASGTPLQITLLLDTSGSMERADRQESIASAMQVLTSQLTPNDTVTLIGFARQPRLIQDRLTGEALKTLPSLVKQTPSEGGTNLEEALLLGADHARRQFVDGGQNRIVLITDGAANLGDADAESLRELVVGLRQEGIAFDACGVGAEGLNDNILEALTREGDGRYYLLNKPEDADAGFARQLAGAFRPAARNVKVQVRFNEQRVGSYRLLGFEKHRLKKEDFRNDKVDAAEMASAEAGVALYEFEPLPQGDGEVGEVSVRFQDMTSGRMIERTWTIAYEEGVPALEEASPSLQLASTAAFLAEKLKRSTFGQSFDLDQLNQILTNIRQCYGSSQAVTDLIAMIAKAKEL